MECEVIEINGPCFSRRILDGGRELKREWQVVCLVTDPNAVKAHKTGWAVFVYIPEEVVPPQLGSKVIVTEGDQFPYRWVFVNG